MSFRTTDRQNHRFSAPRPGRGEPRAAGQHPSPAPLLLLAHGSRDPRHAATVEALADAVRALVPELPVTAAYLDHCAPRIAQVAPRLTDAIAVPLLLNRAFHAKHDIPAALRAAGSAIPVADVLGPSPLLLDALDRRLAEAGLDVADPAVRARTGVVLAAAGSSDPAANATTRAVAAEWRRTRGWAAVSTAYASATTPTVADALAALRDDAAVTATAVAPYLLAPGLLPDRIATAAGSAHADHLAPVLGAAPELARLVLARHTEAAALARRTTAVA
ncbi:sirohydrochlorin chelatase [Streptomyces sp. TLI_171]|uniref:sirohydrochlorin chelatase n=1 Tax=Streptomyces sp. TLI_171 TaxID=1938859 RepID=UPI000C18D016|nr:sirohydrochlorin chelatase [Streptomyces sp. TLI_171]RKE18514.1 sirohydrochlorin ferrochelatase [Streptomyces sp. TLI_171]